MGYIHTGSNTTMPIGSIQDYNNTNPSKGVAAYRITTASNLHTSTSFQPSQKSGFASMIYGDGPYSLLRPNSTSEILAKNLDLMA